MAMQKILQEAAIVLFFHVLSVGAMAAVAFFSRQH
jgi:hypothetical protein